MSFKEATKKLFEMSDLSKLSYYLGIEVKQDSQATTMCQAGYAMKILEKLGLAECKSLSDSNGAKNKVEQGN